MNVEELKRIVVSQREEMEDLFKGERIIERDVNVSRLRSFIAHPNILAILGVRRSGKSIFSWMLMRGERYAYVNFFDERLSRFESADFERLMQAFYELYGDADYLIFDEIQSVENWEKFLSRLRTSKRIVITGSNSHMLSGELATYLTGRYVDFELFPFNFREHLKIRGLDLKEGWEYSTREVAKVKKELESYLYNGGFPEFHLFGKRILQNIYQNIIDNDVLRRYDIKKSRELKDISRYLISNFSGEYTYRKLKNITGLRDSHTVSRYVDYLSSAYLIFSVERFSYKLKEQIIAPKKVYAIDTGLISSVSFQSSENIGRLMENLVFLELTRRYTYGFENRNIYYWKDHQGREVDFVIKNQGSVENLIQVTYASSGDEIDRREKDALIKASEELKCRQLKVITWDYEDVEEVEGKPLKYVPLWKWLLIPTEANA